MVYLALKETEYEFIYHLHVFVVIILSVALDFANKDSEYAMSVLFQGPEGNVGPRGNRGLQVKHHINP